MSGTLHVGTSGFAYPDWAPAFYPPGSRGDALLPLYAARLAACELNNTYYRQPSEDRIRAWVEATPPDFRFTVKAQRGGSARALANDPDGTLPWLLGPLGQFGARLGAVLFRVPDQVRRDDRRLHALLAAWPRDIPAAFEFRDPSWTADEVFARLREAGVAVVATELDGEEVVPDLRLTGPFLYLRLRRDAYTAAELGTWADRIVPFLAAGHDAYAFFRHDATGASALRAIELARLVDERMAAPSAGR